MAASSFLGSSFSLHTLKISAPLKPFFFIPTGLAFISCILIFINISELSNFPPKDALHHLTDARMKLPGSSSTAIKVSDQELSINLSSSPAVWRTFRDADENDDGRVPAESGDETVAAALPLDGNGTPEDRQWSAGIVDNEMVNVEGKKVANNDVFHARDLFLEDYKEMNRSLKIYIYPHQRNNPFSAVFLPEKAEPGGNYASESYFKKALFSSHFITKNPLEADLFYLPFSIATLRNHPRVGVAGIPGFVKDYIFNISHRYPFWNRTGGADHFYVACHSVGRSAMEKAVEVKLNAIQLVCSSSYFVSSYFPHKDASIPQIWPRKGEPKNQDPSKREKLAFYAGAMNSRERKYLVETWGNDSELSVHRSRLKTPYSEALVGSKYCIHAKGFEVNTARIGDAIYHGCVPVILADHYDLPFGDILNWKRFSVVVSAIDIPLLKRILREEIKYDEYLRLHENVVKVQKHFRWHQVPVDFDAFYMAVYELWIRRSHLRIASAGL